MTSNATPNINRVILPIIKKVMPNIIAQSILGVQPMTGPAGSIFTLNSRYKFSDAHWIRNAKAEYLLCTTYERCYTSERMLFGMEAYKLTIEEYERWYCMEEYMKQRLMM